jgi:hypothetical protein
MDRLVTIARQQGNLVNFLAAQIEAAPRWADSRHE